MRGEAAGRCAAGAVRSKRLPQESPARTRRTTRALRRQSSPDPSAATLAGRPVTPP
jgi:hypothetical protein